MSAQATREAFSLRGSRGGVGRWAARHVQAALATLGVIARTPLASGMTVTVIGVALALPAGLQVGLLNLDRAVSGLGADARISLFLEPAVGDTTARALASRLSALPEIAAVEFTGRRESLAQYERMIGLDGLEALLGDDNPLPAVIDVVPVSVGAEQTASLARALGRLDEVELVRVDLEWIGRLEAIVDLGRRALWLLAGFLAGTIVVVVGNTLRLTIDGRRDEIAIMRAFGGTDAFIRRPFLYNGAAVGLGGGVFAWLLVLGAGAYLDGPVRRLADLYGSEYSLSLPGASLALVLGLGGAALGLGGATIAVGRHLGWLRER